MMCARVKLFALGHFVIFDEMNELFAPCISVPAANVSLNTAEEFRVE